MPKNKWVQNVMDTSFATYPPSGIFTLDPSTIADAADVKGVAPKGLTSWQRMVLFHMNRSGKNLSEERKQALKDAIVLLSQRRKERMTQINGFKEDTLLPHQLVNPKDFAKAVAKTSHIMQKTALPKVFDPAADYVKNIFSLKNPFNSDPEVTQYQTGKTNQAMNSHETTREWNQEKLTPYPPPYGPQPAGSTPHPMLPPTVDPVNKSPDELNSGPVTPGATAGAAAGAGAGYIGSGYGPGAGGGSIGLPRPGIPPAPPAPPSPPASGSTYPPDYGPGSIPGVPGGGGYTPPGRPPPAGNPLPRASRSRPRVPIAPRQPRMPRRVNKPVRKGMIKRFNASGKYSNFLDLASSSPKDFAQKIGMMAKAAAAPFDTPPKMPGASPKAAPPPAIPDLPPPMMPKIPGGSPDPTMPRMPPMMPRTPGSPPGKAPAPAIPGLPPASGTPGPSVVGPGMPHPLVSAGSPLGGYVGSAPAGGFGAPPPMPGGAPPAPMPPRAPMPSRTSLRAALMPRGRRVPAPRGRAPMARRSFAGRRGRAAPAMMPGGFPVMPKVPEEAPMMPKIPEEAPVMPKVPEAPVMPKGLDDPLSKVSYYKGNFLDKAAAHTSQRNAAHTSQRNATHYFR